MPTRPIINLKTFLANADDMIGIFDTDFRLMSFNQKFADTFYQADNIKIKKEDIFSEILHD